MQLWRLAVRYVNIADIRPLKVKRGQAVEICTTWISPTLKNSSYRANWLNSHAWVLC